MERIFKLLGHPSMASLRVKSLWQEYEARETPEAKFVKDLDVFELAVQGVEYENCESWSPCPFVVTERSLSSNPPPISQRVQNASGLLRVDRASDSSPISQA